MAGQHIIFAGLGLRYSDLLALAFQGALRGEDLLGEVLPGVRLRGCARAGSGANDQRSILVEEVPGLGFGVAAVEDPAGRMAADEQYRGDCAVQTEQPASSFL
jgi:hypothetical protein